uniref:Putative transporter n=1 Tax=mine drainage metagenome TaxID=410659 RepID=E6PWM3_9ZZZZ
MTATTQDAQPAAAGLNKRILPYVFFSFACYLVIGVQLAVLPGYVHLTLGFSTVLAGLVISAEYVATVVTRPFAGWVVDRKGAQYSVLVGLVLCGASGAVTLVSGFFHALPWLGLTLLLAGRLLLGASESLVATGATVWGIVAVGTENTATVISWNGICTYGGVAAGAPIGVFLVALFGFPAIGVSGMLLGFASIALALRLPAAAVAHGEKLPYHHVFGRVAPFALGLGLGSIGFGVLATFITLDFAHRHWQGAAFALTLFGALFIFARLLFADWINRAGGFVVAAVCFSVETLGLLTLWQAHTRPTAFAGAALTGFGFSLVFPALGVEAVRNIPPQDKGTALGAYAVFMDISLMVSGPVAGAIISGYGYPPMYLFAGCSVLAALLLTLVLGTIARSRRLA